MAAVFAPAGDGAGLRPPRLEPAKRPRTGALSAGVVAGVAVGCAGVLLLIRRADGVFFATVSAGVLAGEGVGFACAVVLVAVLLLMFNDGRVGVGEAVATGGFVAGVRLTGDFSVVRFSAEELSPVFVPGVEALRAVSSSPS